MAGTPEPPEGLLLVDKPAGPTSHDIVERVRRTLRPRRAGHAGTLDPFATGLLVVLLGRATRLVRYLGGGTKSYEGMIRLGLTTDTDDVTGRPLEAPGPPPSPTTESLRAAALELTGPLLQEPPVFSARKVGGVPAHRRARRGQAVVLTPSPVIVHAFQLGELRDGRLPFRAVVSPGTYIRALARDLGRRLGTGACLESLRRVGSEPWRVEDAVPPDAPPETLRERLLPLEGIPLALPEVRLDDEGARGFVLGRSAAPAAGSGCGPVGDPGTPSPEAPAGPAGTAVRVVSPAGALLGIGRLAGGGGGRIVQPEVVLAPRETA